MQSAADSPDPFQASRGTGVPGVPEWMGKEQPGQTNLHLKKLHPVPGCRVSGDPSSCANQCGVEWTGECSCTRLSGRETVARMRAPLWCMS